MRLVYSDLKHLHPLIPKVIDNFHSDASGLGFVEGTGGVAIQRGPGFFVDLGLECGLERTIGVVRAQEVGVADEETFLVIISVDEPARNSLWTVATHFTGLWMEYVNAVDSDL